MTLPQTADVVIIGGGIVGVSIAYHLAQRNAGRIVVLERSTLGSGSTGRSVASIDLFALHPAAMQLQVKAYEVFTHFAEQFGTSCGLVKTGFAVLGGPEHMADLQTGIAVTKVAGVDIQQLTSNDFAKLEPTVHVDDLAAIAYVSEAGYADPVLTLNGYATAARQQHVQIEQGHAVTGIVQQHGRVTGVTTKSTTISTPVVVCAAGPWSARFLASIGLDDFGLCVMRHPVIVMKGQHEQQTIRRSMIDQQNNIYARPETGGLTLAGSITPEVGYSIVEPEDGERRVAAEDQYWCAERLVQRYPALETAGLQPGWTGLLSISPDWQPVLGAHPDLTGFYCATGFSGQGFKISPAVGDLMAGLLVGESEAATQLQPFCPSRFREDASLAAGRMLAF